MDISSKLSAAFHESLLLWEAINGVAFTVSCVSRVSTGMFLICSAQFLQPLVPGVVGIRGPISF